MASFASAADMAALLQRTFTTAETTAANLALDLVTGEIKAATNQDIELVTNDVATLHGTWDRYLTLPQWPVVSVSAVSVNLLPVPVGTWLLAGDRLYRGNLPIFNGPDEWGGDLWVTSWLGPAASVQVTYTHGFSVIPSDVKGVCLKAAMRLFNNPTALTAETAGSYSHTQAEAELVGLLTDAEIQSLQKTYSKSV